MISSLLRVVGKGYPSLYMVLTLAWPIFIASIAAYCLVYKRVFIDNSYQIIVYFIAVLVWSIIGSINGYSTIGEASWKHWKLRFKTLLDRRHDHRRSYYAQQVLAGYGDELTRDVYTVVYNMANVRKKYSSRVSLILRDSIHTQKRWEVIFIMIFVLFGWI